MLAIGGSSPAIWCERGESLEDARKYGELFKSRAGVLYGLLVTLPNFGDERAVANTIRFSGLDVTVLAHAFSDDPANMTSENRRDSLCGKLSVYNIGQYGIPFSLTTLHTSDPTSESFREDLRTVRRMRRAAGPLLGDAGKVVGGAGSRGVRKLRGRQSAALC